MTYELLCEVSSTPCNYVGPNVLLVTKAVSMEWTKEQKDAFINAKSLLQSTALLVNYDTHKPLVLACDASPYGVGAVLSHVMGDGSESPLDLHHELYPQLRKDIHSSTRKHCSLYLVSLISILIYMGDLSLFFQTTGLSCICWGNIKLYL